MKSESKASRLAEWFQDHIDSEDIEAGFPLGTKTKLSSIHDVALGTLNETLRLLQDRGYVTVRSGPKGGVFVAEKKHRLKLRHTYLEAKGDPKYIADCLHVRESLEVSIAEEAAKACTPEKAELLRRSLRSLSETESIRERAITDWDLHRSIAQIGENHVLAEIYCSLLDIVQENIRGYTTANQSVRKGVSGDTYRVHEELVEAIVDRDIARARRAAVMHNPVGLLSEDSEIEAA